MGEKNAVWNIFYTNIDKNLIYYHITSYKEKINVKISRIVPKFSIGHKV